MGLSIVLEEIAQSLGFSSANDMLWSSHESERATTKGNDQHRKQIKDWFDLVHEVQINAQSSVTICNDLLQFDKIESGSLDLELSAVPIWKLIESTVGEFKLPLASKKIKLQLKLPVDEEMVDNERGGSAAINLSEQLLSQKVVGDRSKITQVLRNLIRFVLCKASSLPATVVLSVAV